MKVEVDQPVRYTAWQHKQYDEQQLQTLSGLQAACTIVTTLQLQHRLLHVTNAAVGVGKPCRLSNWFFAALAVLCEELTYDAVGYPQVDKGECLRIAVTDRLLPAELLVTVYNLLLRGHALQ